MNCWGCLCRLWHGGQWLFLLYEKGWMNVTVKHVLLMNPFLKCYEVNGVLSNWRASLLACFLIFLNFTPFLCSRVSLFHFSSTLCSTCQEAVPLTISLFTLIFTFVVHSHHFCTLRQCFSAFSLCSSLSLSLFRSLTSCYYGDRPSAIMNSFMLSSQTCSETHTHIHNATRE